MQHSRNSVRKDKVVPDYTADYTQAKILAKNIQDYYHQQGHMSVKCWPEPFLTQGGYKMWTISSNIVFSIKTLSGKVI